MDEQHTAMLLPEAGLDNKAPFFVEGDLQTIGSSSSNEITISHPYVSRKHCQIRQVSNIFYITDLASSNGTYLNNDLLPSESERVLVDGDRIELSNGGVRLRFRLIPADTSTLSHTISPSKPSREIRVERGPREVWIQGQMLVPALSPKEFDILYLLYSERGNFVSKDDIAIHGWPERGDNPVGNAEIEQCIRRIRKRIELNPRKPELLVTRKGVGYGIL